MKKALITSALLLFSLLSTTALHSSTWLSFGIPVSYAENQLDDYDSRWTGYTVGAQFSLDLKIFKWDRLSLTLNGGYVWKDYTLPDTDPPWFVTSGGFMHVDNFRFGYDIRFWATTHIILSLGQQFSTSYYAQYGDSTITNTIRSNLMGTDTYLKLGAGYTFFLNQESQLMLEMFWLHNMTSSYQGYEREYLFLTSIRYKL